MKNLNLYSLIILVFFAYKINAQKSLKSNLTIVQNPNNNTISVFRKNGKSPIVTQVVRPNFRPFIHPIVAPDGNGILTEYSPGHHKHQTGIYIGYTRVNGRDYFHHPEGDYWRKKSTKLIKTSGLEVKWETVYDLLGEKGEAVLTETQTWTMREQNGKYLLNLEWEGEAQTDVTMGKYDYGGLFVRMPWQPSADGEVWNGARQRNEKAEGQRSNWVDVGIKLQGRNDRAHITVFDHPDNKEYPQPWRVDGQLGFGTARARKADWSIKKGETELIKHQIVIHTGQLNDVNINNLWSDYTGREMPYALWGVAQQEGHDAKFLTPDSAVLAMTMKAGFKTNVWAAEPMLTQPMAFCWDDRGRLWIAENRDYESRGHGFSKAGNSRILILEDTNHDGVADTQKVFLEGIAFPAAMAVGFDGLFLGAPPNLLFVPDKNHDDKADIENIEIRLTGWGIRDRHETLNSFHWGPDGWLYGCQGFATTSKVRKPTGKAKIYKHNDAFPEDILEGDGVDINGGVWRYHPTKDIFEVVAHGFSNPWGIDYNAMGQLFISACVIPHIWHVIPGGVYHRQGGQHFNPYLYSDIRTIGDHTHRSAHGGARVYQSDAFPAEHQGRIFMANIHEHAVLSDVLEKKGSGFVAKHGDELIEANNAQWVGFSMEVGPDGGLYVLDWHDADICGKEVLNGETGRIFRIMPENNLANNFENRFEDLSKLSDLQLVNLQTSSSDWHSRRARLILQSRAYNAKISQESINKLHEILSENARIDYKLRALWTLHNTENLSQKLLIKLLNNENEYLRAWAIQLSCESKNPSAQILEKMQTMAISEPSAVVRLYLAAAIQRIPTNFALNIAQTLSSRSIDITDHNIPKMIWFGLEPYVVNNLEAAKNIMKTSTIPLITNYIARRFLDANQTEIAIKGLTETSKNTKAILEGINDALDGRYDLKAPKNWIAIYAKLKLQKGEIARIATEIAQKFGDTEASQNYLALLKNEKAPINQQKIALKTLANQKRPELKNELKSLFENPKLRLETIDAIANFDDEKLGSILIAKYSELNVFEKHQAIQTLSARPKYGWQLTQALKSGKVPKSDIPAYTARQLLRVVGSGFIEVWGPIEQEQSLEKAYNKYHRILTPKAIDEANVLKGEAVFQKACGSCHKMHDKGGNIGPELTGSNRSNLDYLLFNVLNPSGEIQEDYKLIVITTRDGRSYSGNIIAENDRQITLRMVGQEAAKINKSDIQSREKMASSLMPVGIFETLKEQEVLDLVKFMKKMN